MTPLNEQDFLREIADYVARRDAPKHPCECPKCKCDIPCDPGEKVCVCCELGSHNTRHKKGAKNDRPRKG